MGPLFKLFTKIKSCQIVRFLLVGAINTAFSYLVYAVFLYIGIAYQFANFLAVVAGILFSFKTQGNLVFYNSDNRLLGRFVISWIVIYLCTITVIGQLIKLGFDPYMAGALSLPFSIVMSYITQKFIIFKVVALVPYIAESSGVFRL